MPAEPIRIAIATAEPEVGYARALFREYAESLGWDASGQCWLTDELAALPGPYAPPAGALLLAFVEERPAGVLGLQAVPENVLVHGVGAESAGELKRLYVRPEHRRRGIGRLLMERAEGEAERRGYDSLVLTTSAEMMPLAQELYSDLGYRPMEPYRTDMPWPGIRWLRKGL